MHKVSVDNFVQVFLHKKIDWEKSRGIMAGLTALTAWNGAKKQEKSLQML